MCGRMATQHFKPGLNASIQSTLRLIPQRNAFNLLPFQKPLSNLHWIPFLQPNAMRSKKPRRASKPFTVVSRGLHGLPMNLAERSVKSFVPFNEWDYIFRAERL